MIITHHLQNTLTPSFMPIQSGLLQRKCPCGQHTIAGGECTECRKKRDNPQRKAASHSEPEIASPIVHEVLRSLGQPLDPATRAFMESRFGHDFSGVRVHTDAKAAESARAVNALAYTVGWDVVFGAGQFAPETGEGRRLLAHELTHVAQQNSRASSSSLVQLNDDTRHESEAASIAEQVADHGLARITSASPVGLQRQQQGRAPALQQIPGISTPLERTARPRQGGGRTLTMNGVTVIVLPDVHSSDESMRGRAETTIQFNDYDIQAKTRGDRVRSFTGPGGVTATIQTTYGPGVSATSGSAYGRGTTSADTKAGRTSLGFHEGRHGRDYIEFLRAHRHPRFTGRVGMTAEQFQAAMDAYNTAVTQYQQDIDQFSKARTDCVGTTIDEHMRSQGVASTICERID